MESQRDKVSALHLIIGMCQDKAVDSYSDCTKTCRCEVDVTECNRIAFGSQLDAKDASYYQM